MFAAHTNVLGSKPDLAIKKVKRQCLTIILATFRSLVPDDLCKDSVPRHPRFYKRRFLKVLTIYGCGGHLGQ